MEVETSRVDELLAETVRLDSLTDSVLRAGGYAGLWVGAASCRCRAAAILGDALMLDPVTQAKKLRVMRAEAECELRFAERLEGLAGSCEERQEGEDRSA